MDKTGTLTKGQPAVTDVVVDGVDEDELLALAAAVEAESEHPLAAAIVRYAVDRRAKPSAVNDFRAVPGHGATAVVGGRRVAVGNRKLMIEENADVSALMGRGTSWRPAGARRCWWPSTGAAPG
jgi:Cu2+-exporting ATPase